MLISVDVLGRCVHKFIAAHLTAFVATWKASLRTFSLMSRVRLSTLGRVRGDIAMQERTARRTSALVSFSRINMYAEQWEETEH